MSGIVTFYSYKGGVGRTMALANVAVLLAQRGLRVLVVDWDLEAPGLERYFGYFTVHSSRGGLLSLLRDRKSGSLGEYRRHVSKVQASLDGKRFEIDLLQSGREGDAGYTALLESFDWERYFEEGGGDFIEALRDRWRKDYDIALIDSRTGLSDTGGICTIQLPDTVVALFTANYQSLYGVRDTMALARSARDRLAYDRMRMRVLPVPARFSQNTAAVEAQEWLGRIAEVLGPFYQEWLSAQQMARQLALDLAIPQVDSYGFGEKLAVIERDRDIDDPMVAVYERIADLLTQDAPAADAILELSRSLLEKPEPTPQAQPTVDYEFDIFVSHASGSVLDEWLDKFMAQLVRGARVELGQELRVFFDHTQIRTEDDWPPVVRDSLLRSRLLLAIVTPEYVESQRCRREWATFEQREKRTQHGPLILPLLMRRPKSMPDWVLQRQCLDYTEIPLRLSAVSRSEKIEQALHDLSSLIAKLLASVPAFDPTWQTVDAIGAKTLESAVSQSPPSPGPASDALDAEGMALLLRENKGRDRTEAGRTMLRQLVAQKDFARVVTLGEALHARLLKDFEITLAYGRGLVETGKLREAEKLLKPLLRRTGTKHAAELLGACALLGRIYKQLFVAAPSQKSREARRALTHAIEVFRFAFNIARDQYWFGVNLVTVASAAHRLGFSTQGTSPRRLARSVLKRMTDVPPSLRERSFELMFAALHVPLEQWYEFLKHMELYLATPELSAVELDGALTDLVEFWDVESLNPHAAALVAALRARLLSAEGGAVKVPVQATAGTAPISSAALESILGASGHQTFASWTRGIECAKSVGLVKLSELGHPIGTCFLVEARDFGFALDEPVLITAAHVLAVEGGRSLPLSAVEFRFEAAASGGLQLRPRQELWRSGPEHLDVVIIRLLNPPALPGLRLASSLPALDEPERVYLIGHPTGEALSLSLQDNELLDYDGRGPERATSGPIVRVHYRAPTEGGSSGSPVFNQNWEVIALHHKSSADLPRLNGHVGTYPASEGIWIRSIVQSSKKGRAAS
jgi:MinD-like ATPase involved in chromosome partitioning or flagellar assembly